MHIIIEISKTFLRTKSYKSRINLRFYNSQGISHLLIGLDFVFIHKIITAIISNSWNSCFVGVCLRNCILSHMIIVRVLANAVSNNYFSLFLVLFYQHNFLSYGPNRSFYLLKFVLRFDWLLLYLLLLKFIL